MPTLCINCTEIIDEKIEIEIHMLKEKKLSMISLKINPEPDRNPKWTLKQAQPLLILRPGGFQQHWMHPGPAKNYHRLLPPPNAFSLNWVGGQHGHWDSHPSSPDNCHMLQSWGTTIFPLAEFVTLSVAQWDTDWQPQHAKCVPLLC